jgi:hypothetical protein
MITFTKPVDAAMLADPAHYEVKSWRYEPTEQYGGPKVDVHTHQVTRATASPDFCQTQLEITDLAPGRVYAITLKDMKAADGTEPWSTNAWYTLNAISKKDIAFERFVGSPVPTADAQWLYDGATSHASALQMAKDGAPCDWKIEPDGSLAVHTPKDGIGEFDIVSRAAFEDCFVHVEWLSPVGGNVQDGQRNGNSGIKLMERYEVQIMNTAQAPEPPRFNESGSIYRQTAPDVNASTGADTWQSYDIWFTAPRWETNASDAGDSNSPGRALSAKTNPRKLKNARMTVVWNGVLVQDDVEIKDKTGLSGTEAPGPARILLQSHPSDAEGPVRFRNIWVTSTPTASANGAAPIRSPALPR